MSNQRRQLPLRWVLSLALASAGLGIAAADAQAQTGQKTFARDVAPILQRACENCHFQGGPAPMSLVTYEEVRPWVRAIQQRTAARDMPPWYLDKNVGIQKFRNDPSLSDAEIKTIADWAAAGAARGNPADMPPPIAHGGDGGWTIGQPDLVVSSPAVNVPAVGADTWGEIGTVPTGLTEDRYIKEVEIREIKINEPTKYRRQALHHAAIHSGPPALFADGLRGEDPQRQQLGRFRITYELGQQATVYPETAGVLLEAGSAVLFSTHLHAIGQPEDIRVDIGFKFHPKGYKPKYPQSGFVAMGSLSDELDIPAGETNARFDGFYRMPKAGIVTTFEPHMHMTGERMCYEALYPDGKREMLNCAGYNHNWVKVYVYDEDVAPLLPKDTVVHVVGWFNNSTSNKRVLDPRNWKGYGQRTIEDMFINLAKVTFLTDEQFKVEVEARKAKQQQMRTTQEQQQQQQ